MSLTEIFETMEYGPAPESAAAVNAWLDDAQPPTLACLSTMNGSCPKGADYLRQL